MPAKRPALKEYSVSFKVQADVDIVVCAATPEEAIAKGRELETSFDNFIASDVDVNDGIVEVRGCWARD